VPAAREDPAQLHVDGLDLADLDLDDLNDLDVDELDLDDLSLDDPGQNRSDPDGALQGDTVEARTVTPDQKTGGAGPMPPGPRSALPTRGTAHPGAVPVPRTEHVPRTDPVAPVDAEVVDDSTGGPGGFDPTGMDVMLIVSSLKASLAFYEGMLHMPVLDQTEGTAVLSSGGGRIILQQMAEMSPVERRVMHLQLRVRNVEAVYHELRRRGVTFAHRPRVVWPTDRDEVTVATCRDPDGHAVSLTEWRVRSTGSSSD
jgi:catechol 2,3-dioxygenase-like lactoylglutathione lyase family enzyme